MKESQTQVKDPICGMTVDPATAKRIEHEGKSIYFCSDRCKDKFATEHSGHAGSAGRKERDQEGTERAKS